MKHGRSPKPILVLLLVCPALLLPMLSWAQKTITDPQSQTTPQSQPAAPALPSDPLKRETPYGTVTGFLKAAGQKNYELAAKYIQMPRGRSSALSHTALEELEAVLNHDYYGSLDMISRDPEGRLDDGLRPDLESIGKARIMGGHELDIGLVRLVDPKEGKIWFISAETIQQIPDFYRSSPFTALQNKMPGWLYRNEFFSLTILELLLFLLAIPIAWLLSRLILSVVKRVLRRILSRTAWAQQSAPRTGTPLTLAVAAVLHYRLVIPVLPLLQIQYYGRIVRILFVIAIYWLISNITDEVIARVEVRLPAEKRASAHSMLGLGRRVWKALVFLILLLIVLKTFGFEVNSALAGIGIGGIALGLGAQKTLENLFGGVAVLSDGSIRVGDFCKIGDQLGTVEDIGVRATRIRTLGRTVVSIPNGSVAMANLENFASREKILLRPLISLRYETSADQLRYVIARIRELLYRHSQVETETLRVRFINLGQHSLDVEIFAYILTADYTEFLAIQEGLLLSIMDIVEESGTGFAFPSQTTYLGRDPGLDPEKTKAALAVVESWKKENRLPFPDHDADTIARLSREQS